MDKNLTRQEIHLVTDLWTYISPFPVFNLVAFPHNIFYLIMYRAINIWHCNPHKYGIKSITVSYMKTTPNIPTICMLNIHMMNSVVLEVVNNLDTYPKTKICDFLNKRQTRPISRQERSLEFIPIFYLCPMYSTESIGVNETLKEKG